MNFLNFCNSWSISSTYLFTFFTYFFLSFLLLFSPPSVNKCSYFNKMRIKISEKNVENELRSTSYDENLSTQLMTLPQFLITKNLFMARRSKYTRIFHWICERVSPSAAVVQLHWAPVQQVKKWNDVNINNEINKLKNCYFYLLIHSNRRSCVYALASEGKKRMKWTRDDDGRLNIRRSSKYARVKVLFRIIYNAI